MFTAILALRNIVPHVTLIVSLGCLWFHGLNNDIVDGLSYLCVISMKYQNADKNAKFYSPQKMITIHIN